MNDYIIGTDQAKLLHFMGRRVVTVDPIGRSHLIGSLAEIGYIKRSEPVHGNTVYRITPAGLDALDRIKELEP